MNCIFKNGTTKTYRFGVDIMLIQYRKGHYETLKIPKTASQDEIKSAYFRLSKQYHPDMHKNDKKKAKEFVKINEAYSVLGSKVERWKYDQSLNGYTGVNYDGSNRSRADGHDWTGFHQHQSYQERWSEGPSDEFSNEKFSKRLVYSFILQSLIGMSLLLLLMYCDTIALQVNNYQARGGTENLFVIASKAKDDLNSFHSQKSKKDG